LVLAGALARGQEGVMAKQLLSMYRPGKRSASWNGGQARNRCPVRYVLFDLLYHAGNCLMREPLVRRRELHQLGKVQERSAEPVDTVGQDAVNLPGSDVGQQRCSAGRSRLLPLKPPSS
jgi:ATP-dependent DNA ligase